MKAIIYDCEIVKAIPSPLDATIPGIEYCGGWDDHANMGISCIGVYDYEEDRYRVFLEDNFGEFYNLVGHSEVVIGFNSVNFDNKLASAVIGRDIRDLLHTRTYDLLREVWIGDGLSTVFNYKTHGGYRLNDIARANGLPPKSGHGALAPVQWQQGQRGAVIDYCLMDVKLTKDLIDLVLRNGMLNNPKRDGQIVVAKPWATLPVNV
jgi:hypothetical protein